MRKQIFALMFSAILLLTSCSGKQTAEVSPSSPLATSVEIITNSGSVRRLETDGIASYKDTDWRYTKDT